MRGVESTTAKIVYMCITYFIWEFFYTIGDIPFWGMSAAISPNPKDRSRVITSARLISGAIGGLVGPVISIFIDLQKSGKIGMDMRQLFFILGIVAGTFGMGLFSLAGLCTKERVMQQSEEPKISDCFKCLVKNKPLLLIVCSNVLGTVESIAEITPAMLYDSCKAFYAPGNMVLAAAGNTTMEQILAACKRHGLMEPRPAQKVQRLWATEPMTLAATEKTLTMPVSKPCFGVGFKEEPLSADDLRTEALYDLVLSCIVGGMSPLYRRLYDEGLVNPGFGGEVLRVDGCCCILFTGESDVPDTVRQLLLDEIARVRAAGVDREVFTLCKNEKYGQLIENLENVEDSASQMADFALSGQTVAQQISMLAGLTAEDADAALQHILCTDRMATMYILPDGTAQAAEEDEEEEE